MTDLELTTPQQAAKNELNNVLTAIALKCELLRSRDAETDLPSELHEIEQLARRAVDLIREIS